MSKYLNFKNLSLTSFIFFINSQNFRTRKVSKIWKCVQESRDREAQIRRGASVCCGGLRRSVIYGHAWARGTRLPPKPDKICRRDINSRIEFPTKRVVCGRAWAAALSPIVLYRARTQFPIVERSRGNKLVSSRKTNRHADLRLPLVSFSLFLFYFPFIFLVGGGRSVSLCRREKGS